MNGRQKTFLLGVGCQKGGSTWLHDYLNGLPDCNFGLAKEYHTFDARHLDLFRGFHTRNVERRARLIEKKRRRFWPTPSIDRRIAALSQKIAFCENPERYADYFDDLWRRDRQAHVVGDITPGYAGLEAGHFAEIKRLLESRGFDVKVAFVMRDPVARCYSAARFPYDRKLARGEAVDAVALLEQQYASPAFECRTRYEATINALESTFAPEQMFLALFEEFFTASEIGRLNRFLGIRGDPPAALNRRVNPSQRAPAVPGDLAARIFGHYRPTYEFCAERFGAPRLQALWRHY